MAEKLWLDYESRSECDLPTRGSFNYCQHPTTKVLCAAYAFDDEDVQLWWHLEPFPKRIAEYFASDGPIYAHNAQFDRLLTWYCVCPDYGVAEPALERWYCTAAQARANCLPGSLEDVGRALSSKMRKDHRGSQLIRQICMPPFNNDPVLLKEFGEYAMQDVRTMRAISKAMRDLSATELADYHVSERINDRGVLCDVDMCRAAERYAASEIEDIQAIVREVTKGEITTVRSPKMRQWVLDRVGPMALKLMETYKDGEKKYSIDKSVRANLLAFAEENPDEVPEDVAEVVACADDLWASAVAKFSRMSRIADEEDRRIRGAFVFAGGGATGRYSSYGIQVHNLPRKAAKNAEAVRTAMVRGHSIVPQFGKRTTDVLKGMLRPALIPKPGHVFVVADWSAIEGRVNPWLAASSTGEAKLDVFRSGKDPYIVNAAATYRRKYEEIAADHEAGKSDQRQVGKVQELALGFSGGVGAFASMGKIYGLVVAESEAQVMVDAWRRANPWAMNWWQQIERAYTAAMRNKGKQFDAGRVSYLFDGVHLWYALPSGRVLCYPFAKFEEDGSIGYLKAAWKPAADAKEWPRGRLWRGLACIAKDTPVLTERGWVAIQRVSSDDKVWDGVEWVKCDGVAYKGVGEVIYSYGVSMTPDHKVLTSAGWKRADEAERYTRVACRLPDGYTMYGVGREARGVGDQVRLRTDAGNEAAKLYEVSAGGEACVLRVQEKGATKRSASDSRYVETPSIRGVAVDALQMLTAVASSMGELRRSWNIGVCRVAGFFRCVLAGHGADILQRLVSGSNGQQRPLYAGELPVGFLPGSSQKHAEVKASGESFRDYVGVRTIGDHGHWADNTSIPDIERCDRRGVNLKTQPCTEVFDVLNCGPRNRFVVMGIDGPVIVHNCENVTQACANDLLRTVLRDFDDCAVLHVHDEVVLEVPESEAQSIGEELEHFMTTPPEWAKGLPLDVEWKIMQRYGK